MSVILSDESKAKVVGEYKQYAETGLLNNTYWYTLGERSALLPEGESADETEVFFIASFKVMARAVATVSEEFTTEQVIVASKEDPEVFEYIRDLVIEAESNNKV